MVTAWPGSTTASRQVSFKRPPEACPSGTSSQGSPSRRRSAQTGASTCTGDSSRRSQTADTRDLTRLAHHAEAAADKEAVLRYAPAAAEEAHAAGAYREAAAQYGRALRFAASMTAGERAELLERQSDSYYLADYQVAAIDALRQAIDLYRSAGDTSGEARALSGLVTHLTCRGLLTEAEDAASEAIGILERRPDGAVLAEASNAMALLSAYRGDAAAVDAWGEQAGELATEPATSRPGSTP